MKKLLKKIILYCAFDEDKIKKLIIIGENYFNSNGNSVLDKILTLNKKTVASAKAGVDKIDKTYKSYEAIDFVKTFDTYGVSADIYNMIKNLTYRIDF